MSPLGALNTMCVRDLAGARLRFEPTITIATLSGSLTSFADASRGLSDYSQGLSGSIAEMSGAIDRLVSTVNESVNAGAFSDIATNLSAVSKSFADPFDQCAQHMHGLNSVLGSLGKFNEAAKYASEFAEKLKRVTDPLSNVSAEFYSSFSSFLESQIACDAASALSAARLGHFEINLLAETAVSCASSLPDRLQETEAVGPAITPSPKRFKSELEAPGPAFFTPPNIQSEIKWDEEKSDRILQKFAAIELPLREISTCMHSLIALQRAQSSESARQRLAGWHESRRNRNLLYINICLAALAIFLNLTAIDQLVERHHLIEMLNDILYH